MFKTTRTVYFENNKKKITTKKYETYKRAKAYAKRYSKLVNGARFVEVEIKFDTDSFKFKNVDIFVADSNGFENEHLEEIEKFQKETEEQNVKYTVSRFACSPEKEFDTVGEARLFAEECAKNYGFVYTINKVQGTTAQVREEIAPLPTFFCLLNFIKRRLSRAYGVPVHRFLIQQRLQRARELIRTTRMPIQQIAQSVGYEGMSQFSAAFKQAYGTTPGRYRKMSETAIRRPF